MTQKKLIQVNAGRSLRSLASDPLLGFPHEALSIPEWQGFDVVVRAPSLADRMFHIAAVRKVTGVKVGDSKKVVESKLAQASDHQYSAAALVVRVLYERVEGEVRRVFRDDEVDVVASAFGEPHALVFAKAIELGSLGKGAEAKAKKPLARRRTSASE